MSKQFYNYLSDKIKTFFENKEIRYGDKYYIQFDEKEHVNQFYDSLKETLDNISEFSYQYNQNSTIFNTFCTKLDNDVRVIVVNSNKLTPDFLVTLRNRVTDQEDEWKNTALLIICCEINDSIVEGTRSLEKDDMPLNIRNIKNNLEKEIDSSKDLSKEDKTVANFYLEKKLEDQYQTTLWDYEDILSIIQKGEIKPEEYETLGLFYDSNLSSHTKPQKINRLTDNAQQFEDIKRIHQYDNKKEELEKKFDSAGVNKLSKDTWCSVDYTDICKSQENQKQSTKKLNYYPNEDKHTVEGNEYWEKAFKNTKAGERKRHIIVFNNKNSPNITLKFEFDSDLDRSYINPTSKDMCKIQKNKLTVSFDVLFNEPTFKKVTYTHFNLNKSKYEFNIVVLPCDSNFLRQEKTNYLINTKKNDSNILINHYDENEKVILGINTDNAVPIAIKENDRVPLENSNTIKISNDSEFDENDCLEFKLNYQGIDIPIKIKEETNIKTRPVKSLDFWKYKREKKDDFVYDGAKAKLDTYSFSLIESFKDFIIMEEDMVKNEIIYGKHGLKNPIEKIDINISLELKEKYLRIIRYYQNINNVPSFVYLNDDLKELYADFINEFNKEVSSIPENNIFSSDETKLNLLKIGTIQHDSQILFSSLSPLNIAYQLEINKECKSEELDSNILSRLTNDNLLPYLYSGQKDDKGNDILYRPIYQEDAPEWNVFERNTNVSVSTTNAYIAKVVKEKIEQFIEHFKFLFIDNTEAPFKLNIININDDKEIVKGVFNFIRNRLIDKNKKDPVIPVEINIYNKRSRSYFDTLFSCKNHGQFEDIFDIQIKSKEIDLDDILKTVQNNITYYKHELTEEDNEEIEYSHISFYKVSNNQNTANNNINDIETGISMNGLLSEVSSIKSESGYRTGFGTKNLNYEDNTLIKTAINLNELSLNNKNNGENVYQKNKTIITQPNRISREFLNNIYNKSRWVTFIEPTFGLEYFENGKSDDLVIIHYSDQYSSSNKYDTITITNKSNQYKNILKEYLLKESENNMEVLDENLEDIIKLFNSINGEWLLKIVSSNFESDKEKINIIAAIKYMLSILNHDDIFWIPISMEEILRIAQTVKLSRNEGIFDKKLITGNFSDDLLFIGVNLKDNKVYYYPIEVKKEQTDEKLSNKAIKQAKKRIDKTCDLLKEQLFNNDNKTRFRNKFYRNFFMQLALSTEEKLALNNIYDENKIKQLKQLKNNLVNDEYVISTDLESIIGKGCIISFTDNPYRLIDNDSDISTIELTKEDIYTGLLTTIDDLNTNIHSENSELDTNKLLSMFTVSNETEEDAMTENISGGDANDKPSSIINANNEEFDLSNIRALIGKADGTTKDIYWEYGNPALGNRHLLIQGKSGQGKTYFIQRLILELSNQNIPTIIIDYTDGFKESQLEDEFKGSLGDNLIQYWAIRNKIPINPFKKYSKRIDENFDPIDEDEIDVANRFKSVIKSVYKLGSQQTNSVYEAVKNGLKKNENMNLHDLKIELESLDKNSAETTLDKLRVLIDKNPFDSESDFDWTYLDKPSSNVTIIQLTGLAKDIQKTITEFILWDLWYYKASNGSKDVPFAVVLDESQNLDFSDKSPCAKILQEGRKFGWSCWFATQFVKGKLDNNAVNMLDNAEEKIFFNPPSDSVDYIAKSISTNNKDIVKNKLLSLKKGQCIVYGPIYDNNELQTAKPIKVNVAPLNKDNDM